MKMREIHLYHSLVSRWGPRLEGAGEFVQLPPRLKARLSLVNFRPGLQAGSPVVVAESVQRLMMLKLRHRYEYARNGVGLTVLISDNWIAWDSVLWDSNPVNTNTQVSLIPDSERKIKDTVQLVAPEV